MDDARLLDFLRGEREWLMRKARWTTVGFSFNVVPAAIAFLVLALNSDAIPRIFGGAFIYLALALVTLLAPIVPAALFLYYLGKVSTIEDLIGDLVGGASASDITKRFMQIRQKQSTSRERPLIDHGPL